jgi:hypothetical protein
MIDYLTSYPRRIICLTEQTTETLYLLGGDAALGQPPPDKPVEHAAVQ